MPSRDNMGLDFGLESFEECWKMKFRWLITIEDVVGGAGGSSNALPPLKGSRPELSFKEQEVQHMNETVYFPLKPEWKPIQCIMYDTKNNENPVYDWIKDSIYDPSDGTFRPSVGDNFKRKATIEIFNGCGEVMETWDLENCYASEAKWGELDMALSELVTVEVTLRYDRAIFR